MTPRRLAPVLLLATLVLAGALACSTDEPVDQRVLHSVMLGTEDVLSAEASADVDAVGLRLRALGGSLAALVEPYSDPSVARSEWLDRAPAALDALAADVAELEDAVRGAEPPVRNGFAPYAARWRDVLDAQERLVAAVRSGDPAAEAEALAATDEAVARLVELDEERVARVVEAFGEDEARRLLELER